MNSRRDVPVTESDRQSKQKSILGAAMGVRGDMQLLHQAISKRWLTEELRPLALQAIRDGLQSDDDRVKQAAIKNLLLMEAQNQKDEQHDDHIRMDEGRNRVLALLGRGGADPSPRLIEQRGSDSAGGCDQRTPSQSTGGEDEGGEPQ